MIFCLRLIFVYETANQKFKQNAPTQDVDGMQALPVVYMKKVKGYISTTLRFMRGWEKRLRASSPLCFH